MRRLPPASRVWLTPLVLSLLMTAIISAISTVKALGWSAGLASAWVEAYALSWIVAFPVLLLVLPLVRRVVDALVATPPKEATHAP